MKHKHFIRIGAALVATVAVCSAFPVSATYNKSTTIQAEAFTTPYQTFFMMTEQYKFPDGKYWNSGDPDTYTDYPCSAENHRRIAGIPRDTYCTHFKFNTTVNVGYTQLPKTEIMTYVTQCYGFARKLAYDFYGGCNVWLRQHSCANYKPRVGDQLRLSIPTKNGTVEHSIFVTEVKSGTIKFADCNWDNTCQIRWNNSATVQNDKIKIGSNAYSLVWYDRPCMSGDVNGDTLVNSTDVAIIKQMAEGTYQYPQAFNGMYTKEAGDINNDGKITMADWDLAKYAQRGYLAEQRFLTGVNSAFAF